MHLWNTTNINEALKADLPTQIVADNVVIDSRKVQKNSIFIALKGNNFDGNEFALQALENGAALVIADSKNLPQNPNILIVEDSLQALVKLAEYKRSISYAVFIGVTGSVGKTTVKEALGTILSKQGKTHITTGNLNNHIGLPLTLANLPDDAEYAVIELGMNHKDEIRYLTNICKPNITLITFIAAVHIEFFKSVEEIAFAKAEIFEGLTQHKKSEIKKTAILPIENEYFELLKTKAKKYADEVIAFGSQANNWKLNSNVVEAEIAGANISFKPFQNSKVFINNMLAAITAAHSAGADLALAAKDVEAFSPPKGRGRLLVHAKSKATIIDDAYNASPESMRASVNYLKEFSGKTKIALLGDMRELGERSPQYHASLADAFEGIDKIFLFGKDMQHLFNKISAAGNAEYISNFDDITKTITPLLNENTVVLIKSSNGTGLHKIVDQLNF